MLAGFPPSVVDLPAAEKISSKLQNQETIRVEVIGGCPQPKEKGKKKAKAKAAPKSKAKGKAKAPPKRKVDASWGGNVHTLSGSSPSSKAKKSKKASSSASSSGGSVMTLGGPKSSSGGGSGAPKRRRMKAVQLTSKDDAQSKLVAALSTSGAKDTASQFLRAATRGAVLAQYEIAKANARYSAALAGDFTIEECANIRRLGDTTGGDNAVEMVVSFRKEQHYEQEQVSALTAEEVAAVVRFVLEKEGDSVTSYKDSHMGPI